MVWKQYLLKRRTLLSRALLAATVPLIGYYDMNWGETSKYYNVLQKKATLEIEEDPQQKSMLGFFQGEKCPLQMFYSHSKLAECSTNFNKSNMDQETTSASVSTDPIDFLFEWVRANGAAFNVEVKEDPITGVRGLYASKSINQGSQLDESEEPVIQIPNRLIVSPYHIRNQVFGIYNDSTYADIFDSAPELFDPKYPYKPNSQVQSRKDNEFGEYFQLAFFIISEKLKGKEHSSWWPFINYLPKDNQTLYTYPDDTRIHPDSDKTLQSEIQLMEDDIIDKIKLNRQNHKEQKERFMAFWDKNEAKLKEKFGKEEFKITEELFEWGWMNVGTRVFGAHQLPSEIAMVPLLDLMNHDCDQAKLKYYLEPYDLHRKITMRNIDNLTNKQLELDYQAEMEGFDDQDPRVEWQSQDLDQHQDDYPDRYYNYQSMPKKQKQAQSDSEDSDDEKLLKVQPIDEIWDLGNEKIKFGVKPLNKNIPIEKGEELHLCYGERANSFLVIEYGFALSDNRYDFVRLKNIDINFIINALEAVDPNQKISNDLARSKLNEIRMKECIQADLKLSGLNGDLLKMIRCCLGDRKDEVLVLKVYNRLAQLRLEKYPTSLRQDLEVLQSVQKSKDYHWMYQYVLIYRIGQKEILTRQSTLCQTLIQKIEEAEGNVERFKEITQQLRSTNNMLDYLNDVRDIYY